MDAYTFVLGQLREDDFKRLSSYKITDGCTFETWLSVVARSFDECRPPHVAGTAALTHDGPDVLVADRRSS